MQNIELMSEVETLALGAKLAGCLNAGDVVAMHGGLGAGKTTLSRGIIKTLTDASEVPSPTYTLVQIYDAPQCELWHCDMYRLEQPNDAWELGLIEAFEDAICLIEWPDKLGSLLPGNALGVNIEFDGEGRKVTLTGWEGKFDPAI